MTDSAASRLPIEPWSVREIALDLGRMGQMESLFALSNGHIGLRGNLDEGEPSAIPGTYLGSFYERRPFPYPATATLRRGRSSSTSPTAS